MPDWTEPYKALFLWLGLAGVVMFLGSLVLVPVLIARLPADYFAHRRAPRSRAAAQHPALRLAARVGKNVLGGVIVLVGVGLLPLPGQGVLTILIGLALLEFPGKRQLELAIVRQRQVLKTLNWIRRRAGQPPLEVHRPDKTKKAGD